MSHFFMIVVTENGTDAELNKALQPFHEFECTGIDDEYVKNVDELQEARKEYDGHEDRRYKDPFGTLYEPYDSQFYREPTEEEKPNVGMGMGCGNGLTWHSKDWGDGRGYRTKVHFMPEGWEEVKIPTRDTKSFAEFVVNWQGREIVLNDARTDLTGKHKYGYCRVRNGEVVEVINRTNPNSKWDWWTIGGRWDNRLMRTDSEATPNQGRKCELGFDSIMDKWGNDALCKWELVHEAIGTLDGLMTWKEALDACPDEIDKAREMYGEQPRVKAFSKLRNDREDIFGWDASLEDFAMTVEDFVQRARRQAITPHAILLNGKWIEKGEMGWWACVSNEKEDWPEQYEKIFNELPDNAHMSVIDCHI